MKSSGRAINSLNLFYDYGWYFLFIFLKGIGNEFENLLVWICNISWQLGLFHLFVLLIWSRSVKGDRGTLGTRLWERPQMGRFSYLLL